MQGSMAVLAGQKSDCPFCTARLGVKPDLGARIIILNDFRAGMTGTVSNADLGHRFPMTAFIIFLSALEQFACRHIMKTRDRCR